MLRAYTKNKNPPGGWVVTEPLTQVVIRGTDWIQLRNNVVKHRKGVNSGSDRHGIVLDLEEGWEARLEHEICLHLPEEWCHDPENPEPYRTELEKRGRKLWKELHDYAAAYPETPTLKDMETAREWYRQWSLRIPNFNCACRRHWEEITSLLPPDFSGRRAFQQWTVDAHNRVNALLGKAQWTA